MARRGYSRGRPQSSGVARDWGNGPGGTAVTSMTATGSSVLGSGITPLDQELTVLRTRGLFTVFLRGPGAGDGDGFHGAVGIGKCTTAAFAAGIGSLNTPLTEPQWDGWLWHSFFDIFDNDTTFASDLKYQRMEVDSKAMRKFDAAEVLFAAIEVVEVGTVTLNAFFDTRMLFQDSGR